MRRLAPRVRRTAGIVFLAMLVSARAPAQDLEPKAYSASPIGTVFLVAGAARSSGSVLTDPTLPLKDAEAGSVGSWRNQVSARNLVSQLS